MRSANRKPRTFLGRLPWPERTVVTDALRTETVGGIVLLVAAAAALVWANTPASDAYASVRDFHFGIKALGLDLSVAHWTADGLLTIFFFVAGAELKRELVVGELRHPGTAILPVVAAVCGMAIPAVVYGVVSTTMGGTWNGWAVPMATDIAFALGILAVIDTHLPASLRAFLLTLAVVDDLGAIVVIALFYTSTIHLPALIGAILGLALFFHLHDQRRVHGWYWYLPLALIIWGLTYASGVHATVAGVAMGLLLRAAKDGEHGRRPVEQIAHLARPISAGVAVPLFALFAAGVTVSGDTLGQVFSRPEPLGVALGLAAGKVLGVFGGCYLAVRFARARLGAGLAWADVIAVAMLAGVGFTVSLLIGELAYPDPANAEYIKAAVLVGSLISALLASLLLKMRNTKYRRLYEEEIANTNADDTPDIPDTNGIDRQDGPAERIPDTGPQHPDAARGGHGPGAPRGLRSTDRASGSGTRRCWWTEVWRRWRLKSSACEDRATEVEVWPWTGGCGRYSPWP
ncbi:Na(+)/H(+) antiporter NhaA [Streptomyces sp. NBRC 110611]|uniref:Na+/H+ antiporter NhaA n=1 Tax=Streptomyces sp. NBRC 110611 TaxID=1621259 RepID=UPI000858F09D|nr:Na+/H+ antiporter NhaA [Streptomyces sp. NBRC 110611]GAU71148.1 Na(+)/H(+) antiporter NhaA [Streptomyces sp. NBRC 110611]